MGVQNPLEERIRKTVESSLRNWMLKSIILNKVSRKESYPYDFYKKLKEADISLFKGVKKSEVYNVFNSLESKGLIKGEAKMSGKRMQREYAITKKGARVNAMIRRKMKKNIENIKMLMDYDSE